MAINASVQNNGGFLPDVIMLLVLLCHLLPLGTIGEPS